MDLLTRLPGLRWLSAGQLDGMTDSVIKVTEKKLFHLLAGLATDSFQHWMEHGNLRELESVDLDSSDNLSEDTLQKFLQGYGSQLKGKKLRVGEVYHDTTESS